MKIYTKKGDTGETSLLGGTRVPKHHLRIEAYGTVDETNSFIGLIRDQDINETMKAVLLQVQDCLFIAGSALASDPEKSNIKIPKLSEADVVLLEQEIDRMNEVLPELKNFILPGGHTTSSYCHLARCVCRRAERLVTHLKEEEHVEEIIIKYLNRLSDYLFVCARMVLYDKKCEEIVWNPRG